ncbi:acyl-CoA Delta(11) desaturase-like [Pectinophora gossypiella]|uniref:acyl-CoA Delta(11) desaturase-like n=1 Tax=Pectinophora gossypiella TaxID=13191 RepID=UPI00214F49AB|nr:acyl-CoA Delta(11) desaturase-like [Pectinophora gossypiella]
MSPNSKNNGDILPERQLERLVAPQASPRKFQIVYFNILTVGYTHLAALYGIYLCFTVALWKTLLLNFVVGVFAAIGVGAGAHRLWSHRSYKAKFPLEILLMIFHSMAFQNTVIDFVRDHRLHHKYSDTDADPHNATRGFFYSHYGWLLVKKHPEVTRRGQYTDMSDIYSNPVLNFQRKYAIPLIGTVCFILPTFLPVYFWGETVNTAWHICMLRYALNLNFTFSINSFTHMYGYQPFDKNILPVNNFLANIVTLGEGHHNFHHVFPWDYRGTHVSNLWNISCLLIDLFAWIGWAYGLKTVPEEVIQARIKRTAKMDSI